MEKGGAAEKCDKNVIMHLHVSIIFWTNCVRHAADKKLAKTAGKKHFLQHINVFVYCLINEGPSTVNVSMSQTHMDYLKQSIDWLVNKQLYQHTNIEIYK